jgi:aspartyl-tRNA(Asn)/glutamyl-tRNA(Gln) amidotransferase subunit C
MSLEQAEIEKIAALARIRIAPAEMNAVTESISSILEMVDQMQAVDTAAVEPMSNPLDASQRLRADRVSEEDQREQFQQLAPQVEAGLYLVPRVID